MNQKATQGIVGGVGQTAPRVTIEQIEAEIEYEYYFTGADGMFGAAMQLNGTAVTPRSDHEMYRTLFCVLVLNNGIKVEGVHHGSISAANQYPREKCEQLAREKAIDKLWPMFGFELAQKLYREKQTDAVSSLGSVEGKFRKKPVVIEAVQIVKGMDIFSPEWFAKAIQENKIITHGFGKFTREQPYVEIPTLEGTMRGDAGDWLIKGVKGEFYPCKPDIFAATYEAA